MKARPYQGAAVDAILEAFQSEGIRSALLLLPTGCVAADTQVSLNRAGKGYSRRIDHAYRQQSDPRRGAGIATMIRSLMGERIGLNEAQGILSSGDKPTCALVLSNGKNLRATADHEVMTENGWVALGDLSERAKVICEAPRARGREGKLKPHYRVVEGLIWHPYAGEAARLSREGRRPEGRLHRVAYHRIVAEAELNGISPEELIAACRVDPDAVERFRFLDPSFWAVHHRDGDHRNNRPDNLEVLTHSEHQALHGATDKLKNLGLGPVESSCVVSVKSFGVEHTYDVVCRDPHRNFVANGIVVHNCGKTVVAGLLGAAFRAEKRRILFLAHRDELINQAARTFKEGFGLKTYIEQANRNALKQVARDGHPDIVAGSVATMQKNRLKTWGRNYFDLVISDECHRALAPTWRNIYDHFEDAWHLGVTATGDRSDGKNLGQVFQKVAFEYTIGEAVKDGWLVPIRYRKVPIAIDLKGVKVTGGDYSLGDLEERIGPKVEPMCRAVAEMVGSDPFVSYTPDVGTASAAASIYDQLGIKAVYVAGEGGRFGMDIGVRRRRMAMFERGEIQALICCQLLDEGWDSWRVRHVVIMRPTRQRNTYIQRVGRGTRPVKGLVDQFGPPFERRAAIASSEKSHVTVIDFDWEADEESRRPVAPIVLFDDSAGGLKPDVRVVFSRLLDDKPRGCGADDQLDLFELKAEAEKIVRVREELRVKIKGFRLPYRIIESDPFYLGSLVDARLSDNPLGQHYGPPITEGQWKFLRHLGHPNPEGLSQGDAGRLIYRLKERRNAGLAHPILVDELVFVGVDKDVARSMTHDQAGEWLRVLQNDPDLRDRFREYNRLANEEGRFNLCSTKKQCTHNEIRQPSNRSGGELCSNGRGPAPLSRRT